MVRFTPIAVMLVLFAICGTTLAHDDSSYNGNNPVFKTTMLPKNEVPPITNNVKAFFTIKINLKTNTAVFTISVFNAPNVTALHIHKGAADANGPVLAQLLTGSGPFVNFKAFSLTKTLTTADLIGVSFADVAQLALDGNIYINLHTGAAGIARGQLALKTYDDSSSTKDDASSADDN